MSGGKSKKVTIGYRYYFSIAMGLCRGIDGIKEIKVGGKPLLNMGASPSDGRTPLAVGWGAATTGSISKPDLFGGDEGEGGIVGSFRIGAGNSGIGYQYIGGYTSQRNPYGSMPNYDHKAVFCYDGQICAMNPYPKPWSFRVCRYRSGVASNRMDPPDGIMVAGGYIYGANPAHALAEILMDDEWGRGLSDIDWESFNKAGWTLRSEGMAFCLAWKRDGDLGSLAQTIIDQIGGVLYQSPSTGLMTMKLIRADYNVADLDVYTPSSGLMSVEENSLPVGEATVNEVIVNYIDPISGNEMSVREQNIASIQSSGGIRSVTTSYPGCPTGTLAVRLAKRDLNTKGARNLRVLGFHLDQRGFWLMPGDVIVLHWPERNIHNMVVRLGSVSRAPDGRVEVKGAEDIFGLPTRVNAYVPTLPPPTVVPKPGVLTQYTAYEATYAEVMMYAEDQDPSELLPTEGILMSRAAVPREGVNAKYLMETGTALNRLRASGDWNTHAYIAPGFQLLEGGTTVYLVADEGYESELSLFSVSAIIKINDEYMRVMSSSSSGAGLPPGGRNLTVRRGGFDTIPKRHGAGASVWGVWHTAASNTLQDGHAIQEVPYPSGTSVPVILTPRMMYDYGASVTTAVLPDRRFFRPYPPADVRLQGDPIWGRTQVIGDVAVSWVGRNRVSQDTAFVGHAEANVALEAGAETQVRLYNDDNNALLKSMTATTELSFDFSEVESLAVGYPRNLRVELYSTRDGLNSRDRYIHRFTHVHVGDDTGWGFRYGENFGE